MNFRRRMIVIFAVMYYNMKHKECVSYGFFQKQNGARRNNYETFGVGRKQYY